MSSKARVFANLVIASNGATTLRGSSKGLSSPEDRRRFHDLREEAAALVIGGKTFRSDPYQSTPKPLFVSSRRVTPEMRAKNPDATFASLSPTDLVKKVASQNGALVLVEGGLEFIKELVANRVIDKFFLTRTSVIGDSAAIFDEELLNDFQLISTESSDGETFEVWERISRSRS